MKYIVSVSGGKDSTATLLWALDTLPREDIVPAYMDTQWEHYDTYAYLEYLEDTLDIKIHRIETEGMVELSKRKKTMPNPMMRFCTYELKIKPFIEYLYMNFIFKGIDFINLVGVRREESKKRSSEEAFKLVRETYRSPDGDNVSFDIKILQPIVYWDTQRVFDFHRSHKIDVNPLYKRGLGRVGCYPCIYSRVCDLKMMEPKYVKRLRKLEDEVSSINKNGGFNARATWFTPHKDKHLRPGLDFGKEFYNQCVNQYGICESFDEVTE